MSWFLENSGCSTTSCRPPWPCTVTSGSPFTGLGSSKPLATTLSLPAFSVTSMRPSGRNASDQGCSRPSTTRTTRNECSFERYVCAAAGTAKSAGTAHKIASKALTGPRDRLFSA